MPGPFKRFLLWLAKRGAWFWIVNTFGTFFMTYLAVISDVFRQYAPFSHGVVALGTFLLICFGFWAYASARARFLLTEFEDRRSKASFINPLSKRFDAVRIRFAEFYHPFFRATSNARFMDCEVFGPASVLLSGCTISNCKFGQCDWIIIDENVAHTTLTAFEGCIFDNCHFFRVAFFVTRTQYEGFVRSGMDPAHMVPLAGTRQEGGAG